MFIGVEAGGKAFEEMHVDGGAMTQVFLFPPTLNLRAQAEQAGIVRDRRAYIIRNARLDPDWAQVDRRTMSIAARAIDALLQTQGYGDLNRLYRDTTALHALDCDAAGFEWLVADDASNSTFAWLRKGKAAHERCVVVVNFTPQVLHDYRVRVPFAGTWREVLNSDAALYGGGNVGNEGAVSTVVTRDSPELHIVVPPLAAVFFVPEV